MNKTTKKLICTLGVGVALAAAAPAFADSYRGNDRDRYSANHRDYDRHDRYVDRHHYRGHEPRRVVVVERPYVVQRPYIVERPVYYSDSAPSYNNQGIGSIIGAAIGSIYDYQNQ